MDYPLYKGTAQLGKVQLLRKGLYYEICCRCQRPGDSIYRLVAHAGDRKLSLGVLAPMGVGFGLDRKEPVSHFGPGELSFSLVPAHQPLEGHFVPLSPTEPFAYLSRLKEARFTTRSGQPGLLIPD